MGEIDLLEKYPRPNRDPSQRAATITPEDRRIARQFGQDFFDGPRNRGYGGFRYDGRWLKVLPDFIRHYRLAGGSSVLDVGCAKGFMLHDLRTLLPGVRVEGIDVSSYAIENAMEDMKPFLRVGNARDLSRYKDKSFDLVISINTIHNLPLEECKQALREIQRIGRSAFITVDAWTNSEEERRMRDWNITAQTLMHADDWKSLFREVGYTGDYYWFIP